MSDVVQNILNTYYGFGEDSNSKRHFSSHECAKYLHEEDFNTEYSTEDKNNSQNFTNPKKNKQKDEVSKILENTETQINVTRSSRILDIRKLESNKEEKDENVYETSLFSEFNAKENMHLKEKGIFTNTYSINPKTSSFLNTLHENSKSVPPSPICDDATGSRPNTNPIDELSMDDISDNSSPENQTIIKENKNDYLNASLSKKQAIKKAPVYNEIYFDLSSTDIDSFPVHLLHQNSGIRMLYLENNNLSKLPNEIFTCLKNLEWLDVRRNKITELPAAVKGHASLDTILLQGNKIKKLPLELGLVPTLKRLQVADNPLVFPSKDILKLGCIEIINFLRQEWNKEHPEESAELEIRKEIKRTPSTILCYQTNSMSKNVLKTLKSSSSQLTNKIVNSKNSKKLSTRERSWNYKMSNRYNIFTDDFQNSKIDINENNKINLCDSCASTMDNLKLKNSGEFLVNIKNNDKKNVELPILNLKSFNTKSNHFSFAKKHDNIIRLPTQLPEINVKKLKTKSFDIIMNDGKLMKLYPFRLKNAEWIMAFLENYIGIKSQQRI